MKQIIIGLISLFVLVQCKTVQEQDSPLSPPNIILIITDDQGWNDVGFNGSKDIQTPYLDEIASEGAIFTQGYVSHPYCSPSRAGILTGRYQQHFGHESNPGYPEFEDETPDGLPLDQTLLSQVLKEHGYKTGAIGKWHLGDAPQFWPTERGFDYWYGFSGGGRAYWPESNPIPQHLLHSTEKEGEAETYTYLTDEFSERAVSYIESNKDHPFFLYLAYNAPHAPIQATEAYLERTDYLEDGKRSAYAGMIVGIDEGVGLVKEALINAGIYENTMIIYVSDNGGHGIGSSQYPYRGWKGMVYEGGIRVPYMISWPAAIKGGKIVDQPVISLDFFPTILDAAGIEAPSNLALDGVSLLPYIKGEVSGNPHETLYWRYTNGMGYAVRHGKYKLVHQHMKPLSLFDMEIDPYESNNIAKVYPEITDELENLYNEWNKKNIDALWEDPHIENVEKQERVRQSFRKKAAAGEPKE